MDANTKFFLGFISNNYISVEKKTFLSPNNLFVNGVESDEVDRH